MAIVIFYRKKQKLLDISPKAFLSNLSKIKSRQTIDNLKVLS